MTNNKKLKLARAFWWAGGCFITCMVTAILCVAFQVRMTDWLTANTSWTAGTWRVLDSWYGGISRNACITMEFIANAIISLAYAVLVFVSRIRD